MPRRPAQLLIRGAQAGPRPPPPPVPGSAVYGTAGSTAWKALAKGLRNPVAVSTSSARPGGVSDLAAAAGLPIADRCTRVVMTLASEGVPGPPAQRRLPPRGCATLTLGMAALRGLDLVARGDTEAPPNSAERTGRDGEPGPCSAGDPRPPYLIRPAQLRPGDGEHPGGAPPCRPCTPRSAKLLLAYLDEADLAARASPTPRSRPTPGRTPRSPWPSCARELRTIRESGLVPCRTRSWPTGSARVAAPITGPDGRVLAGGQPGRPGPGLVHPADHPRAAAPRLLATCAEISAPGLRHQRQLPVSSPPPRIPKLAPDGLDAGQRARLYDAIAGRPPGPGPAAVPADRRPTGCLEGPFNAFLLQPAARPRPLAGARLRGGATRTGLDDRCREIRRSWSVAAHWALRPSSGTPHEGRRPARPA